MAEVEALATRERPGWHDGFASGAVYHGDDGHIEFLNRIYGLTSQLNPLHADLWPSGTKYEAEIVSMTAAMLGGSATDGGSGAGDVVGAVTSGGTESILLAMKTYRDRAATSRKVRRPTIVAPSSAHVAFDKAGEKRVLDRFVEKV